MNPLSLCASAPMVLTLGVLTGALPAMAGPVTYQGTIGGLDVIVEFTDAPQGNGKPVAGRYSYLDKGVDIPLNFVAHAGGDLVLAEESSCNRDTCPEGKAAPVGATWTLGVGRGDAQLKGTWAGAKSLPIALRRVASRNADAEAAKPLGLYEAAQRHVYDEEPLNAESAPYDVLKLDLDLPASSTTDWNGAVFAYVVDPRTEFQYPRIVALPGLKSPDAANVLLTRRHWKRSLAALGCKALQYAGFRDSPDEWSADMGTLGGYESMTVEVSQLTGKMMSWQEQGSIWCGRASPSNFLSPEILDIARGRLLDMADLFEGWGPAGPGADLLEFVRQRRQKPTDPVGQSHEDECGTDELMQTDLAARFTRSNDGETVVTFGIYNLPTVINACAGDLLSVSLKEIRPHLTTQALHLLDAD